MKPLTIALKIFCGVYGALLALLGGRWWFSFEPIAAEWLVEPLGPQGVNNLVADMGALFFGGAIMIALGLRSGHSVWLLAVALTMAIAAAGRLFAYATIGYVPETLVPLIFEIASCALLVVTHQRMTSDANALD
jgi:hypothetical protein